MPSERAIIFCVGAVQFVNILDFVIVMPLGRDFADGLGIPVSRLGYVGGAYTAAACVSGLAGAFWRDGEIAAARAASPEWPRTIYLSPQGRRLDLDQDGLAALRDELAHHPFSPPAWRPETR